MQEQDLELDLDQNLLLLKHVLHGVPLFGSVGSGAPAAAEEEEEEDLQPDRGVACAAQPGGHFFEPGLQPPWCRSSGAAG